MPLLSTYSGSTWAGNRASSPAISSGDTLRSLLTSAASIDAYDAALPGSWVPITSTEYLALSSTLAGINWHGTNENGLIKLNAGGTSFNNTLTVVMSASIQQTIPSGSYLVGFAARPGTGNTTYRFFPMVGYTHASGASATYYNAGSAVHRSPSSIPANPTSAYNAYFIRKAPTDSVSANAFPGYAFGPGSGAYRSAADGTPMPTHYATTKYNALTTAASATTPWTIYNSNLPIFQILTTTTKGW